MKENLIAPGPWKVERYDHSETGIVDLFLADANGRRFATKIVMEPTEKEQCLKTYELLKAAPEMLELLKQIRDVFENTCCIPCSKCHELQGKIEAIIEEARGEK